MAVTAAKKIQTMTAVFFISYDGGLHLRASPPQKDPIDRY